MSPPAGAVCTELNVAVEVSGTASAARSGSYAARVTAGARVNATQPGHISEMILSEEEARCCSLCWEVLGGRGWVQGQRNDMRGGSLPT